MSDFKARLTTSRDRVEARIMQACVSQDSPIAEAMRYATQGGKGLRGFLVSEGAALHGIGSEALDIAAAIECLHA